jgi:UDP:flavonoid glycosyltransferase YjiC (YdhE family)
LSKVLICTRGSLGDVLPYIALAHGLQKNGHQVLMVVNTANLGVLNKKGIECVAFDVGQDIDAQNKKALKGLTQSLLGSLKVLRKLGKHLRQEVACIQRLAPSFDLIMSSQTSLAAPLVARALGKPWAFSGVSPIAFISFIDPPYLHGLRWLGKDSVLPSWWRAVLRWFFLKLSDVIYVDYRQIEQELGLPHEHPLFAGRYSPWLNLALFSPLLAKPQADWPANTVQCGFVKETFRAAHQTHDVGLERFLASGPAPIVFTLGSVARVDPQDFYDLALKVIAKLGVRAVLIKREGVPLNLAPSMPVHVCSFADYSVLFRACQCVVHHGGVATLMQVMAARKPSLILPRTLDQFDQAARAKKVGVAEVLPFMKLSELLLLEGIKRLLTGSSVEVDGSKKNTNSIFQEDGLRVACLEIERLLLKLGANNAALFEIH